MSRSPGRSTNPFVSAATIMTAILALAPSPGRCADRELTPAEAAPIREAIIQWWDSIDTLTLHARCDSFKSEADFDANGPGLHFDFAYGVGGKRALRIREVSRDGSVKQLSDSREDGRKRYSVISFKDHPDSIAKLVVTNQPSRNEHEDDRMLPVWWLVAPAGKPLSEHLKQGARFFRSVDDAGERIRIEIKPDGVKIVCVLDRAHDWMPREVRIGSRGKLVWTATRFAKSDGHWFPVSGEGDAPSVGGTTVKQQFVVDRLEINRPLDPSRFSPPELPEGAILVDTSARSPSRIHTRNPRATPEELERTLIRHQAKYAVKDAAPAIRERSAPRAAADPPSVPWSKLIGVVSLMALGLAITFRLKTRAVPTA